MPRKCTICGHPDRAEIDAQLVAGEPVLRIAKVRGISRNALDRHSKAHLPASIARAREAGEIAQADNLLTQIRDLKDRAIKILTKAEKSQKSWPVALAAIREARQTLELLGKVSGELDERPQINILLSASWIAVRSELMAALATFPEAKAEVVTRLLALEDSDGSD